MVGEVINQGQPKPEKIETAVFAAGCFWGVESAFRKVPGVYATRVGYCGGDYDNPTYQDVCSGKTGHAESVEVEFDPEKVSYEELLNVFWESHDPTTKNRQGPDIGTQYRSAIFYNIEAQKRIAEESLEILRASGRYKRDIETEIKPVGRFWKAEEYHQQYLAKKGVDYCH